jgi:purine-binding chemotaxis protein CheW
MNDDPRSILVQRAARLAEPIEERAQAGETVELLRFVCAGERYAIETPHVRRISVIGHVTPVPGAPEHFAGVMNLGGDILPLVDLSPLIGVARKEQPARGRAIVLGRERPEFGLAVDETTDVETISRSAIDESMGRRSISNLVRGTCDGAVVVLDGEALLDDPRLFLGHDARA